MTKRIITVEAEDEGTANALIRDRLAELLTELGEDPIVFARPLQSYDVARAIIRAREALKAFDQGVKAKREATCNSI